MKTVIARRHASLFLALYGATSIVARPTLAEAVVLAGLALPLIWLSVTDLYDFVIPDLAVILVATLGLAHPIMLGEWPDIATLVTSGAAISVLAIAGEIFWRRHNVEALGLGDVKLIGAGILVIGAERLWLMILIAASGGLVAALMARRRGEKGIPFGPFLAYAIFVVQALEIGK